MGGFFFWTRRGIFIWIFCAWQSRLLDILIQASDRVRNFPIRPQEEGTLEQE